MKICHSTQHPEREYSSHIPPASKVIPSAQPPVMSMYGIKGGYEKSIQTLMPWAGFEFVITVFAWCYPCMVTLTGPYCHGGVSVCRTGLMKNIIHYM
jgi:hypothetical protein